MDIYLKRLKMRYLRGNRKTKGEVLDELCRTGNYHRKHAIRMLTKQPIGWRDKPAGRKKKYDPKVLLVPIKQIWLATDQMCGKRLKAALPLWLPHYDSSFEPLSEEVKKQLLQMSAATIDRLLKDTRTRYPKRLGGTKPGSLLKQHIAVKTDQWNEDRPGFLEADTVAHCGTTLLGSFIWSVTLTDIYSGWTENAAVWNKGAEGVLGQITSIESRLPFPILGFDCDNGSEFLNHHLMRYLQTREKPVQFTRSRAYHKGDNAHVEQKNWTHVRQHFGYYRLENPLLVALMNDLYENEFSLLHNYFYPSVKLKNKLRIQSKIKKQHDVARTPCERLLLSEHVPADQKEKIKQIFSQLNPFTLRTSIEKKLKKIFSHVEISYQGKRGKI
jgi:hypothetical protein